MICIAPEWTINVGLSIDQMVFVAWQNLEPKDTPRNPLEKEGWRLTFSDDFDEGYLDPRKWDNMANGPNYDTKTLPGATPTNYWDPLGYHMSNSILLLAADNTPKIVHDSQFNMTFSIPYRVGYLQWAAPLEQKYGYFEIRCKVPNTVEMWPAFWLASRYLWPPELDIFEFYTNNTNSFEATQHWGQDPNHPKQTTSHPVSNGSLVFHIYACKWSANDIRWYYDNHLIRIATNGISDFVYPMFVIINTAVDTRPTHQPASASYPNYFAIDYVRVYS